MSRDRDREYLAELQALPLEDKVQRTLGLIGAWHNYFDDKVYVSLSGGKDSTVLADLDVQWCRAVNKPLNLCFSNTGLEYPEIQRHVRAMKDYFGDVYGVTVNLNIVIPKMKFSDVVSSYGYPLISKETAEAIYYARKIQPREREYNREETSRAYRETPHARPNQTQASSVIRSGTVCRRELFEGKCIVKPSVTRAAEHQSPNRMQPVKSRDSTNWANWRRGCL